MKSETISLNAERGTSLTVYLQDVQGALVSGNPRPAIIILPGGGYNHCSSRESDPAAFPFLAEGYHVFILRYSTYPDLQWPVPLEDYEEAMELILSHREEWEIDAKRISVMGFSAGGHLASAAAVMAKHRPAAAILIYSLMTEDIKRYFPSAPDTVSLVDEQTCPCFLAAGQNDETVSVMNTLEFARALKQHQIPFECHIYSEGPHGCSTGSRSVLHNLKPLTPRLTSWVKDSLAWLNETIGDFDLPRKEL